MSPNPETASNSLPDAQHRRGAAQDEDLSPAPLPFAAPCRPLPTWDALRWMQLGWQDLRRAPRQSLGYGLLLTLLSWAISAISWWWGGMGLYFGVLSGFVLIGPLMALGLYSVSACLELGIAPSFQQCVRVTRGQLPNIFVFALILSVIFLVWARAATILHVFYPSIGHPRLVDLAMFLGIGSVVGAFFCAIVLTASAFSLPMLVDRKTDAVTAVVTSTNAVLRNKPAIAVWAAIIVACVVLGFATAYLAFVVLMPLLGHATWHGYRAAIDPWQWPKPG